MESCSKLSNILVDELGASCHNLVTRPYISCVFENWDVLGDRAEELWEVSPCDFISLLTLHVEQESRLACERAVLEFAFYFFWYKLLVAAVELQPVLIDVIKVDVEVAIVLLHVVASSAPG